MPRHPIRHPVSPIRLLPPRPILRRLAAAVVFAVAPQAALASSAGRNMPWETPLQTIANSLTGPVAYWLALLGIFVAGAALVFGGEINEFIRRLIMLVLIGSVMVGAASMMTSIFTTAAVIPTVAPLTVAPPMVVTPMVVTP